MAASATINHLVHAREAVACDQRARRVPFFVMLFESFALAAEARNTGALPKDALERLTGAR